MKIPLVLGTRNKGKINELGFMLSDFGITIKSLNDFEPIPEIEEDGATFIENAVKKASLTSKRLGIPVLSDDSGLEVTALHGAPGVYSARYAGMNASDEMNNKKLLENLEGEMNREAFFKCVIAIARPDGQAMTFEGKCKGVIIRNPLGNQGFGYDPLFFFEPLKKTFGQMTSQEKSRISHRGNALQKLKYELPNVLEWLSCNSLSR